MVRSEIFSCGFSTVLMAPTSRSARPRSFRATIMVDRLSADEIHALDAALEDVLGL